MRKQTLIPLRADGAGATLLFDSADVEIVAAAGEGKSKDARTITVIAYRGGVMTPASPPVSLVVDLAGARAIGAEINLHRDHDVSQILGQGLIEIQPKQVVWKGTLCGPLANVQPVVEAADNGFKWRASMAGGISEIEFLEKGESATVNGRTIRGPVYIARRCVVSEVSLVSVAGDYTTSVKIAAMAAEVTAMTFDAWLKAKGWDKATLSETQLVSLQAAYNAEMKLEAGGDDPPSDPPATKLKGKSRLKKLASRTQDPPEGDDDPPADPESPEERMKALRASAAAELRRQAEIEGLAAKYAGDKTKTLVAQAIEEGWDVNKAELEIMRAARPAAPGVQTGGVNLTAKAMEAALLIAYRVVAEDRLAKQYDAQTMEAATSRHLRGATLSTLFFECARAGGQYIRPGRLDDEGIRAAFRADQALRAAGDFSTISLSGVLSNLANKALLERFEAMPSAVSQIAWETDTNDFKPFTRYRLDGTGSLQQLGPDGELKHIGLIESTYTNQLETRGGMIALTRVMIINDDLGAFLQIPQIFAELAMHAREQETFRIILANAGNFWHADNGNYFASADAVLSIDAIDTAVKMFRELKGAGGRFVQAIPSRLWVPPALEPMAKRIYKSDSLNETTTANKAKPTANTHQGAYEPVSSPYLGTASGLTGASNTAWWLAARPSPGFAPVQVGYLRGQRTPVIENAETNFNTLGMQWRAYWDFGIALFEKLASVKSKGAA